jgi:hypothetical protein
LKAEPHLTKKGTFKTTHIKEQAETMYRLQDKGYWASFAVGFGDAKALIDVYMELPERSKET